MASSVRVLLEWLSILMLIITLQLPQGPVLYWASSATFTLVQVSFSRQLLGQMLSSPSPRA